MDVLEDLSLMVYLLDHPKYGPGFPNCSRVKSPSTSVGYVGTVGGRTVRRIGPLHLPCGHTSEEAVSSLPLASERIFYFV